MMSPTRVANGVPSPGDTVNVFYCITGKTLKHVMGRMSSQNVPKDMVEQPATKPEMRW